MNSSPIKVVVVLALLIAVVFAVTYFSQYTPTEPEVKAVLTAGRPQPPLRFFTTTRRWDPRPVGDDGITAPPLMDRIFPGFYEADGARHPAAFWFENTTPKPVTVQLTGVSCVSCSGGDLAPIPPDATRQLLQMAAASMLPHGFGPGATVGMAGPAANLGTLAWQSYLFADRDPEQVMYTVPGAAEDREGWSPQWGILRLTFQAKPGVQRPLQAEFKSQAQGTEQVGKDQFAIVYQTVAPFEIDQGVIDVGELTESSPPQAHEVMVFSVTRTPEQLPNLTAQVLMPAGVIGEPGGFVTAGSPTPLTPDELAQFIQALEKKAGQTVRIRSAIRIPVAVKVTDGNAKLDIGAVGRVVWVAQGGEQKQVAVRGVMRGPVFLSEGKEIDLGTFRSADGATEIRNITTERTGIELGVVPALTHPSDLRVTLEKLPDRDDRGYYKIRVTVPPEKLDGEIRDGVVVLEIKGPHPQRLRLPVTGRGRR